MMVKTGTATFHHVARLLVWASHLMPKKLTTTKNAMNATASPYPAGVR